MKTIRVLIVDDEPIARRGIRQALESHPEFEVAGESANGLEAVAAIREEAPDLVFLDVQMPEMDGFEVIEAVGLDQMPAVVFVTAYDKYALRAFDVHAVDYLLKPYDEERFARALDHAKRRIEKKTLGEELRGLLNEHFTGRKHLDRLVVKSGGRIFFLDVAEIEWIEAADNYVELHAGKHTHLVRHTLASLETRLDPDQFIRIRHSAIVNVRKVKELRPASTGEFEVVLLSGAVLESSRRYRKRLAAILDV